MNNTCHCLKDYGGEDCSIYCPILEDKEDNNTYVIDGECFEIETCPKGYILKEETRECILFPDIEWFITVKLYKYIYKNKNISEIKYLDIMIFVY